MKAEVKVLVVVALAAVIAYLVSQPTVICEKPLKVMHTGNFTRVVVVVNDKLYSLTVRGWLNDSRVYVVFYRGVPSKIVQGKKVYGIISWKVHSTVEKLPEVTKQ